MSNVNKYGFGAGVLNQSAGNFKAFAKKRYPDLSESDLNALVAKHYGKDKAAEKLSSDGDDSPSKKKSGSTSK